MYSETTYLWYCGILWALYHGLLKGLATFLSGEDVKESTSGVAHSTPGYTQGWPPKFNKYLELCACLDEDLFITSTYPHLRNIFSYKFGYI